MTTLGAIFSTEGEAFHRDINYRLEGFFFDIVDNIAAEMKRAGLSKTDLARLMDVTPARVTNVLRGYKPNLELKTIVQVAMALDVQPNDLCMRRKTREMLQRPLRCVPNGFVVADISADKNSGEKDGQRKVA